MEWKKLRRSPTPRTQNIPHTAPAPPTRPPPLLNLGKYTITGNFSHCKAMIKILQLENFGHFDKCTRLVSDKLDSVRICMKTVTKKFK